MNKKLILAKEKTSLTNIVKLINKNTLNGVFIINKKKQVIGIIMDSDIRKFLLHKKTINNVLAKDIMKTDFFFLDKKKIINKKKELLASNKILIPILDTKKKLKDYIHLNDVFNKNQIIKKEINEKNSCNRWFWIYWINFSRNID